MAADDWIKIRHNIANDPDVIEIAALTQVDEFGVVGRLHSVWSWLDQHSEDGTNVRITTAFLDRITACPGFAEAMRAVGWLNLNRDQTLTFPRYAEHNGTTAKLRAVESKKKSRQRKPPKKHRDKYPDNSGTNVPAKPGPEERRGDKRREDSASALPPKIPQDVFCSLAGTKFDRKEVRASLTEWLANLDRLGRPPIDPALSVSKWIKLFGSHGALIASVDTAISNGWLNLKDYSDRVKPDDKSAGINPEIFAPLTAEDFK